MKVKYVGFGGGYMEYPCYEDENGKLYFDMNDGRNGLNLCTGAYRHPEDGDICGEPYAEVKETVDKSLWKGILVYVDHFGDKIHRVTYELLGKAKELAKVTGHPVYALVIGNGLGEGINKLLHYGVDKVFVYDSPEFEDFRIEPYTSAFCDFIEKIKPM